MRATSHIPLDMDLTAGELELARVLAELTPATTPGTVTVPAKEMALRAGNIRAKQRLRAWQVGTVLLTAGLAAAMYARLPGRTADTQPVVAEGIPDQPVPVIVKNLSGDTEKLIAGIVLSGNGLIEVTDPNATHKFVFMGMRGNGDIAFALVPLDWELCDH